MKNNISLIIRNALCLLLSAYIALWPVSTSMAQTATLLPNGMQQFFDNNGDPLTAGTVDFYIPSTTTRKNTWQDAAETILNTNPVILDAGGRALIYGDGTYRQVLKAFNGDLIWDRLAASTNATIITTGDGDQVGTIKPWAGILAPNQYAFANGQEVSRTTFSALFTAITQTLSATCTSTSPILTGIVDTTQIPIGAKVELSCVPSGTTIISKTSTSVTVSNTANVNITASAIFFPYGNGNGSTTFNLPDLRGYVIAGRDNMGGTAANRLTANLFGTNPDATGAAGGSQSITLITNYLPPYTPSGTVTSSVSGTVTSSVSGTVGVTLNDPGHNHSVPNTWTNPVSFSGSGGGNAPTNTGSTASSVNTTGITVSSTSFSGTVSSSFSGSASSSFAGNAQGGTSTPFPIIQPTLTLNYIVKITPDTSAQQASGVASLGGMIGAIGCSTGILCTGNNISIDISNILNIGMTGIINGTSTSISHGILFNKNGILGDSSNDPTGGPIVINNTGFILRPFVNNEIPVLILSGSVDANTTNETIVLFDAYGANANGTIVFSKSGGGAGFVGSVTGSVLTVTSISQGSIVANQILMGTDGVNFVPTGTTIVSLGSGVGGIGTYNLSTSSNVSSTTMLTNDSPLHPTATKNNNGMGFLSANGWYGNPGIRAHGSGIIKFRADGDFTSTSWPTAIDLITNRANTIDNNLVGLTVGSDGVITIPSVILPSNATGNGIVLSTSVLATSGNQQYSPSLDLVASGFKTNATAGPQPVEWRIYNVPIQGTANPTTQLFFDSQINNGGFNSQARLTSGGIFNVGTGFQIGGAATTGHVLRGNGTNYIDGQLACSDLIVTCITSNQTITLSGDITGSGTTAISTTLATVNANVGTFGSATQSGTFTVNAKGLITAASNATITPAITSVTGLGTGIATFLATPSSANLASAITDETGTAGNVVFSGSPTIVTPTFTTSFTSPLHIGGSGAASTLTLESTSGAGTTDSILFKTASQVTRATILSNGNIGLGTETNPQSVFVINKNVTTGIAPASTTNNVALLIGSDGNAADFQIKAFGTSVFPRLLLSQSRGTGATPLATGAGDFLFLLNGQGWDATNGYISTGSISMTAGSLFTNTSHETYASFNTTIAGSTSIQENVRIFGSGCLSVGIFSTDCGVGSAILNAQFFMPNITTTSAAQTGTVCWTTGTGKFTVDTTVGCLTSLGIAKNIISRPTSKIALDIVNSLSPVDFRYKDGWGDSGKYEQYGLIAEEVAAIDERLVGRDPNGQLQGVRYQELTAILAGAIKQLKSDNDNLRYEVEQIKRKVN